MYVLPWFLSNAGLTGAQIDIVINAREYNEVGTCTESPETQEAYEAFCVGEELAYRLAFIEDSPCYDDDVAWLRKRSI